MFNSILLLSFFQSNANLPHISKYHCESYIQHCLLVIDEISKLTDNNVLILAAALHDIAKPRTQGINKRGEPCFYGHEEINDEELSQFLSMDDHRYLGVKNLIKCHMVPYKILDPNNFDKTFRKMCRKILHEEPSDDFLADVMLLHKADERGSIRSNAAMSTVKQSCENAEHFLLSLS